MSLYFDLSAHGTDKRHAEFGGRNGLASWQRCPDGRCRVDRPVVNLTLKADRVHRLFILTTSSAVRSALIRAPGAVQGLQQPRR